MSVTTQRIWLVRHGKSSRPFGVVDHQRPLAKRANADAASIRRWLAQAPALFVPSTALRAVKTAQLIAGDRPVEPNPSLYLASPAEFLAVVEDTLAQSASAAFVGHNPTVTQLVNRLARRIVSDSVPTLGVAAFERGDEGWRLVAYVTPKQFR